MKYFIAIIIFLSLSKILADELPYYLGSDIGYGLVGYDANFNEFEGIDKCSFYETGTGNSLRGKLYFEYKFLDFFNAGLHLGYITKSAELNKPDTALARNLDNNKVEIVETGSRLDMNFNAIDIGLDLNFLLIEKLFNGPLFLNLSPNLYLQSSGNFKQTESINSPSGAAFVIDEKVFFERVNAEGDFKTLSRNVFNMSLALFNNSKIADDLYFTQRIGVSQDIGNLLSDAEISSISLFGAVGIKISFEKERILPPPLDPIPPSQPLPIEPKPTPLLALETYFDFDRSYIETGNKLIATDPIVLAVFFDKDNAEIPNKYGSKITEISSVENHFNLFSRILEILADNPNSSISLYGSTSEDEENRIRIAKQRAENVKNKFIELGIEPNRIKMNYSISPKIATNPEYSEGRQENRRVSIELINANSIEFVQLKEFERLYGVIDFNILTKNIEERINFGYNQMPNLEKIDVQSLRDGWISKEFEKELEVNQDSLIIESVVSYEKLVETDEEKINLNEIESRNVDLRTDEFEALLMFEFASPELSSESKRLLKQLAVLLPEGKEISIIGNTDNIGLEEANIKLADERAAKAVEFIKQNTSKTFYYETSTNKDKIDELTPQGRFLNRSIIIRIK